MQEMSDKEGPGATAGAEDGPGAGEGARAGSPTTAEQAAASPLLRALVARYLAPGEPARRMPPAAPPEG